MVDGRLIGAREWLDWLRNAQGFVAELWKYDVVAGIVRGKKYPNRPSRDAGKVAGIWNARTNWLGAYLDQHEEELWRALDIAAEEMMKPDVSIKKFRKVLGKYLRARTKELRKWEDKFFQVRTGTLRSVTGWKLVRKKRRRARRARGKKGRGIAASAFDALLREVLS